MVAALVLFSSALLNTKPSPVFADVRIGSSGPYRFLVDTGAQTSLIDTKLASRLGLDPAFRVEIVTQNSTRTAPGVKARNLSIGDHALPETELVFYDLAEPRKVDGSIRGVLGINALAGLDFTLSPRTRQLEITTERPAGEAVPFYAVERRIGVKARMGSETLTLVLDSGSTHVVLFRTPQAMAKTNSVETTIGTIEGARQTVPTTWTADMFFDRLRLPMVPAAIVRRAAESDGLLPVSVFEKVHVDRGRGEIVLVRRPTN